MDLNNETPNEELIVTGDYIVIQRHNFFKLHHLTTGHSVVLGKDKVNLSSVIGEKFWTLFKMIPQKNGKREFTLEACQKIESLSDAVLKEVPSGKDNRNITDDGSSQALSTDEIVGMRDSGLSPINIVGMLIENSKTFKNKTEYSQEKYLKKKEKKYFDYIIIRRPTLRLLAEIFYNRDQFKVMGLRYDTLSQIITAANIQSNGVYILYESGTQALVGAAILNYLDKGGTLINLSLGNQPQKQAILGMNFKEKQQKNLLSVKISSILASLYNEDVDEKKDQGGSTEVVVENKDDFSAPVVAEVKGDLNISDKKRKLDNEEVVLSKKPRWAEEFERTCSVLKNEKADGLIIASKEFSLNLILKLMPFIKTPRPLVIYSLYREPLVEIYVELKKRKDVINLHLTETWLRDYQILSDRTHPAVTMSASGGHLLSAIIVN
jgi:tRNA (adenine-N(1)-)-methyltransferase non-catalytic subunit